MPASEDEVREGGTYILIIALDRDMVITVGRQGPHLFHSGTYAYCGSAQTNLHNRIGRHFSKDKKKHWHIDYLLDAAEPVGAYLVKGDKMMECVLSRLVYSIPGTEVPMSGFGSSDCRCETHLFMIDEGSLPILVKGIEVMMSEGTPKGIGND